MKYSREMYQPTTPHPHEISSESGDFEEDGDDDDFLEDDDDDDDDDVSNQEKKECAYAVPAYALEIYK